jgi:hypothetical protein
VRRHDAVSEEDWVEQDEGRGPYRFGCSLLAARRPYEPAGDPERDKHDRLGKQHVGEGGWAEDRHRDAANEQPGRPIDVFKSPPRDKRQEGIGIDRIRTDLVGVRTGRRKRPDVREDDVDILCEEGVGEERQNPDQRGAANDGYRR